MFADKRAGLLCAAAFILGASFTLLAVTLASFLLLGHYHAPGIGQVLARPRPEAGIMPERRGRWGLLDPIEIPLANPDGVFPDKEERLRNPTWFFEKFSTNSLARFLNSCDLRPLERQILLDRRTWNVRTNGIEI